MEKSLKEERKLREAAEAKHLDLLRKLKDAKIDLSTIKKPISAAENPSETKGSSEPTTNKSGKDIVAKKPEPSPGTVEASKNQQQKQSNVNGSIKPIIDSSTRNQKQSSPRPTKQISQVAKQGILAPQPAPKLAVATTKPPSGHQQTPAQTTRPPMPQQASTIPNSSMLENVPKAENVSRSNSITQSTEGNLSAGSTKPRSGSIGSPGHRRTQSHAPDGDKLALDRKDAGGTFGSEGNLMARNSSSGSNLDFDPLRPSSSQSDIPTDVVITVPPALSLDQVSVTTNTQAHAPIDSIGQNPFDSYVSMVPVTFASGPHYQSHGVGSNQQTVFDLNQPGASIPDYLESSPSLLSTGSLHPFHQQPMMVVQSQAQPIMLHQVGNNLHQSQNVFTSSSQQWDPLYHSQQNHQMPAQASQQQQQPVSQPQSTPPQQERRPSQSSNDPFDGFLT